MKQQVTLIILNDEYRNKQSCNQIRHNCYYNRVITTGQQSVTISLYRCLYVPVPVYTYPFLWCRDLFVISKYLFSSNNLITFSFIISVYINQIFFLFKIPPDIFEIELVSVYIKSNILRITFDLVILLSILYYS